MRRQGLERAWYTQVQLDPARNELDHVRLFGDRLVTISTAGVVQLLDAATGRTVWTTRVGNPNYPTTGPALDANHVAMINGSTLYVMSATDGREVLHQRVGGAPGGAPALAAEHVFVPLFSGRVEAFPFPTTKDPIPWYYSSTGRVFGQLGLAGESIVWSTDRGYLYNAAANTGGVRYRFQTTAPFVSPVAYRDQTIYALTATGYLYAIEELTGQRKWRYSSGAEAEFPPAVVGDRVYFSTDEPALYCVTTAGELQWIAPGVRQFVSAGTSHIFGAGELVRCTCWIKKRARWFRGHKAKAIFFLSSTTKTIGCTSTAAMVWCSASKKSARKRRSPTTQSPPRRRPLINPPR